MQEKILELYEKIKDQISQEEFQAEMEEILERNKDVPFFDELNAAQEVLKNHGIDVLSKAEELPFEVSINNDNETASETEEDAIESTDEEVQEESAGFTMDEVVLEKYNKVKDKISE